MARPWVVVFLLLLIGFTSQIEWKQQLGNEIEASPNISQKDHHHQQHSSKRQEVVKEKVNLLLLLIFTFRVLCSALCGFRTRKDYKGKTVGI